MEKFKKFTAFAAALCICLSFAACGSSDKDDDDDEKTSSVSSEDKQKEMEDMAAQADAEMQGKTASSAETSSADESSSEAEPVVDTLNYNDPQLLFADPSNIEKSELYGYYAELKKAYDSSFRARIVQSQAALRGESDNGKDITAANDGKLYFTVTNPDAEHPEYNGYYATKLMCFDPANPDKGAVEVYKPEGYIKDWCVADGNIYLFFNNCWIEKYDANGKMTNINLADDSGMIGLQAVGVFKNGMCAVISHDKQLLVDSDLKNVTELPPVEVEAAHGNTEQKEGSFILTYENKLVATVDNEFYCYDLDSGSWSKLADSERSWDRYSPDVVYDNFRVTEAGIYKVDDGSLVSSRKLGKYLGGLTDIQLSDGAWVRTLVPGTSEFDLANSEPMGSESATFDHIRMLTDEYYALIDEYGIFLRTYIDGEDESKEIPVYSFK
ncbi:MULTISPECIES: hypothetical protein [unclassified Ruminococcus]|uniref:hypothetical protein n=1 Tax=unclassified Ruminococcus TaxID=2608920 RepID=UPI0011138694|nr:MULTISPECIES: hypothetical protein [unclassified Ruminococcus]